METNEKVKKNGVLRAIIIFLSIVLIVSLAAFAYAKYVTMQNGSAQAQIAKWSFDSKILNSAQTAEISNLASTRTDNNGEVSSNTIAPGTSGQFILEIDATGTETLLTYETKMTLTNKPKNLKFYLDSNKTQELVAENETYLALNGFIALNDNKKRDISIYWDWPIETGSSPSEIQTNDEIDTTFIGKTMSMQIATTGSQVTSNPYANGVASTTINGNITVYNSVQDAIDAAGTNQGAVVTLLQNSTTENVEIAQNQNIVLDTNGKILTSGTSTVVNNGTLKITGNGSIRSTASDQGSSYTYIVSNAGSLEVENVTIYATSNISGIGNKSNGQLKINNGTINVGRIGIYNGSILNTESNPGVIINNVTVTSGSHSLDNENSYMIIKNGSFTGTSEYASTAAIINITGNMKIENAVVSSDLGDAISSTGGNVDIINGTYIGKNVIRLASGATVNIGTNEQTPNVSTTSPTLIGTNIGINKVGGAISFYDGIIKVPTGQTINSGSFNNVPQGYHIANGTETIEGQEYITAYLVKD